MRKIFLIGQYLRLPKPSIGFGLILLASTQIPLAINESIKLICITTTWADYAVFWDWHDIPLDSRVRYCLGGTPSIGNSTTNNSSPDNKDKL